MTTSNQVFTEEYLRRLWERRKGLYGSYEEFKKSYQEAEKQIREKGRIDVKVEYPLIIVG